MLLPYVHDGTCRVVHGRCGWWRPPPSVLLVHLLALAALYMYMYILSIHMFTAGAAGGALLLVHLLPLAGLYFTPTCSYRMITAGAAGGVRLLPRAVVPHVRPRRSHGGFGAAAAGGQGLLSPVSVSHMPLAYDGQRMAKMCDCV